MPPRATADNARRFHFHECLGRGGHGEVYRGAMYRDGGVSTEIALKVLAADVGADSDPIHRLHDEGRLLGALNHPSLLKVYDLVVLDGRVALVTEFVEGQDLHHAIYETGVPPRVLVEIVARVAEGLHAAWTTPNPGGGGSLRLVHRDIKPQNVRLGVHGEVKLLDFGIARALNDMERESHTKNDIMMGSWPYLAPERMLEQPHELSSAVDVYGLGCVLYEGIAGQRLMEGQTLFKLYDLVDVPGAFGALVNRRIDALPHTVGPAVRNVLRALLAEDPGTRPSASVVATLCEELADRLQGPSLRRWARERHWPSRSQEAGPLSGRDIAEGKPRAAPPETWAPPVTRPRTPSVPPTLEGWLPPPSAPPATAHSRAADLQPREAAPTPDRLSGFVIDEHGRSTRASAPRSAVRRRNGSPAALVALFASGIALFAIAGAGAWYIYTETGPGGFQAIAARFAPEPEAGVAPATPTLVDPAKETVAIAAPEPEAEAELESESNTPVAPAAPAPRAPAPRRTARAEADPDLPSLLPRAPRVRNPVRDLVTEQRVGSIVGTRDEASTEGVSRDEMPIEAPLGEPLAEAPPVPEPPPELAPEPPPPTEPGVLEVQGDALVELRGEFGSFRVGTPLVPGDYEVWADFGEGMVATGLRTRMESAGTITVSCSVNVGRCFVSPKI